MASFISNQCQLAGSPVKRYWYCDAKLMFFPSDGCKQHQYSFCQPTKRRPGWVGLGCL